MKNRPTAYIPIVILIALCLFSCSDDTAVMSRLDQAESMMEEKPEEALALLDTMQRSRLVSREAIARHALLYSQALDKNYIDMTTDSIIRPAVRMRDLRHSTTWAASTATPVTLKKRWSVMCVRSGMWMRQGIIRLWGGCTRQ